ncbi:MAG: ankyrin repeat domain-containing protein, partial [Bryobacteraceae bacterium]
MPTSPQDTLRPLPDRPNLRHLKAQAKDLLKAGRADSLTHAQFQIARLYGFASWPKLKAHVDSLESIGQLKQAIDADNNDRAKTLLASNPELHRAPLGYAEDGPLTLVAECRIPWGPPSPERLALAKWMIENGSDVHQGGDGPLMRAALNSVRIPMMELLVSYGAHVNAAWHGTYPIIFAPCETLDPGSLKWLLEKGADPNCSNAENWSGANNPHPGTALDYVIGSYVRNPEILSSCIQILLEAGGTTKYSTPAVLAILRGDLNELAEEIDLDPALTSRHFPELEFGTTGGRMLMLKGATLLHVAAEYGQCEAARLLLDSGADVNARATIGDSGIGGQTAIFHAATQFDDKGLPIAQLLIERSADLSVRARLPGHYERPGEVVLSCLSWKWRERSAVKITGRTHEEATEALQRRRESRHSEAAF